MTLVVGVTATREGATAAQVATLLDLLTGPGVEVAELHHGDCVGGDADADRVACSLGLRRVSHPPDNPKRRAFCRTEEERPELPYLRRNAEIVRSTGILIAMPKQAEEHRYGGTWSTVRLARSFRRPVVIIRPDGRAVFERGADRLFGRAPGQPRAGECDE